MLKISEMAIWTDSSASWDFNPILASQSSYSVYSMVLALRPSFRSSRWRKKGLSPTSSVSMSVSKSVKCLH